MRHVGIGLVAVSFLTLRLLPDEGDAQQPENRVIDVRRTRAPAAPTRRSLSALTLNLLAGLF